MLQMGRQSVTPSFAKQGSGSRADMEITPPSNSGMLISPEASTGYRHPLVQAVNGNPNGTSGHAAVHLEMPLNTGSRTSSGGFVDPAPKKVRVHADLTWRQQGSYQPTAGPSFREIELRKTAQAQAESHSSNAAVVIAEARLLTVIEDREPDGQPGTSHMISPQGLLHQSPGSRHAHDQQGHPSSSAWSRGHVSQTPIGHRGHFTVSLQGCCGLTS